ncbi:hypothetical protein M8C21_028188 [Ambrosia artemisiifolia]|uniref:Mcm6 C-terminal winged-helix domain-containing protein n=1 Tax=Ambrosia artemisiifolia TaxID=4212 RepID=A0AAD5CGF4_AMBAR|nr:hypothetical protein M8C21_028188 [Ambrosia artemisiifolia]
MLLLDMYVWGFVFIYKWTLTCLLVMRLRQHEKTVTREGSGLAGKRKRDPIQWYVKQRNENEAYESEEDAKAEVTMIKAIIESLVRRAFNCSGRGSNDARGWRRKCPAAFSEQQG